MRRGDDGFTLTELLVAITILGIIMVAIGAMIVTAFRTTSTVSSRLNASRGPKVVSRYWVPDVESAASIDSTGPCAPGGQPIVSFAWTQEPSTIEVQDADPAIGGMARTVTWCFRGGPRQQLVREASLDGVLDDNPTVVVADLEGMPTVVKSGRDDREVTINVTVPDTSDGGTTFDFSVAGFQQVDS